MASTLAELRSKLRDEIKIDPNGKIWSDSQLDNILNVAYFQVQKENEFDWRENQTSTSTTSVSGTQEYALPSDLIRLDLIRYNGDDLRRTELKDLRIRFQTFSSGTPFWYYMYGSNYGFEPIPNDTKTIDILYVKKLTDMSSTVDCAFPETFDEAIVKYASYKAFITVRNEGQAAVKLQDYKMEIDKLLAGYMYTDSNYSFGYQHRGSYRGGYGLYGCRDDVLCR